MRNVQYKHTSKLFIRMERIFCSAILTSPLLTSGVCHFTDGIQYSPSASTNNVTWITKCIAQMFMA